MALSELDKQAILRDYATTSVADMVKALGLAQTTIRRFLKEEGLKPFAPPKDVSRHPWQGRNVELRGYSLKSLHEHRVNRFFNNPLKDHQDNG
jgi:hypothetical protein